MAPKAKVEAPADLVAIWGHQSWTTIFRRSVVEEDPVTKVKVTKSFCSVETEPGKMCASEAHFNPGNFSSHLKARHQIDVLHAEVRTRWEAFGAKKAAETRGMQGVMIKALPVAKVSLESLIMDIMCHTLQPFRFIEHDAVKQMIKLAAAHLGVPAPQFHRLSIRDAIIADSKKLLRQAVEKIKGQPVTLAPFGV
jgi:hypothetical protein